MGTGPVSHRLFNASAALLALVLVGCSTTPPTRSEVHPIPGDRVFLKQTPAPDHAFATFTRDVGLFGSGTYFHLYIDGKKAASLDTGEQVRFALPPGEHVFGVIPTDPFGTLTIVSIDQDLKAGRHYYYRLLGEASSNRFSIQRLPEGK